ncbi:MAG: polyribonucleotide nucleotidyltransferase [Caldiserica bacterium]|nr:polyribonucleotide nucleotidyltransferase [Caldisericota bacterium]MDH7562787.1 polyribonucleotide nucleotidyltransferase [Caldisericota bacterium]
MEKEIEIGGKSLILQTGKLGKQASGSVTVRHGDNVVLVTACISPTPREGIDFFPLIVDYEERLYAAGKIPGGFFKREGRPSEKEILRSRLIDRSIRPLFPHSLRNDVQIVAKVLAADPDFPPDIAAMVGASAALSISPIPFSGPIGAVRIGYLDGKFILNPSYVEIDEGMLDLIVAASEDAIIMVEAGAKEAPEELIIEALGYAHQEIRRIIQLQKFLIESCGQPKLEIPETVPPSDLVAAVEREVRSRIKEAIKIADKKQREESLALIDQEVRAKLAVDFPEQDLLVQEIERQILKEETRRMILEEGVRPDGRRTEEIRPISCEVGILPRVHGCGLFTRGQTQVLTILTLGAIGEVQIIEGLGIEEYKRYMHHYNFPPFSVGEVRPLRGPGRREIGHGALAERALLPVIPSQDDFPYTIRLVSEVLESNGSTSMASVCGSTLALMDAGVPIKTPIAGIAMGLIKEGDKVAVLTDIQGMEDALGDMDFKVAGSSKGITALQMDMKITGIDLEILKKALAQAREARLFILEKIKETIPAPRPELNPNAPRVLVMDIDTDKIREVIGPGGKVIKKIIEDTGAVIDIEQTGRVFITAPTADACQKAKQQIDLLVGDVEIGSVYMGKVTRLASYGAFIEIAPGKEGLLHISQVSDKRVGKIEDLFKVGDQVLVKVVKIDEQHRIGLSRKGLSDDMSPTAGIRGKKEFPDRKG